MEEKLVQVRSILRNATLSTKQVIQLEDMFGLIKGNLTDATDELDALDANLDNTTQRVFIASLALADLRGRANELHSAAQMLKENATRLQEANVEGALNLTREASLRAQKAQDRVEFTQQPVSDSERQRRRTEALLSRVSPQLADSQQRNADSLKQLNDQLHDMERSLPDLNQQVHPYIHPSIHQSIHPSFHPSVRRCIRHQFNILCIE